MLFISTSYFYSFDASDIVTELFESIEVQKKHFEEKIQNQIKCFDEITQERYGITFDGKNIKTTDFKILVSECDDSYCICYCEHKDNGRFEIAEEVNIIKGKAKIID